MSGEMLLLPRLPASQPAYPQPSPDRRLQTAAQVKDSFGKESARSSEVPPRAEGNTADSQLSPICITALVMLLMEEVCSQCEQLHPLTEFPSEPDIRLDISGCVRLRSEEHTSELQSLMRISYAVF